MDIPEVVKESIQILVNRYQFLLKHDKSKKALLESFICQNATERLYYADSVAGLIIAAAPCFLTPLVTARKKDLPSWYGSDKPYRLIIRQYKKKPGNLLTGLKWQMYDEDAGDILWEINPEQEMFDTMVSQLTAKRKERNNESESCKGE